MEAKFASADEVAGVIGIARSTLHKLVRAGVLPPPVRISPGVVRWWLPSVIEAAQAADARPTYRLKGRRRSIAEARESAA